MLLIRQFSTAAGFLSEAESFLKNKELENNQVLGFARSLLSNEEEAKKASLLQVWQDESLILCALIRNSKIHLAGTDWNEDALKLLRQKFEKNLIKPVGVSGEKSLALAFASYYKVRSDISRTLILHELTELIPRPLAPGNMELVGLENLDACADWYYEFQLEVGNYPQRTKAILRADLIRWISGGDLYRWNSEGEMKAMAAIVRKTDTVTFIGLVYTPPLCRGQGFAGSCVQELSRQMLEKGFLRCGLFTDKVNPVSNHLYQSMGYRAQGEYKDIYFE